MEGKQKGRRKIEGIIRTEGSSPQTAGTATSNTMTTSVTKKARNTISAGNNRAHSDERSRKDKCGSSKKSGTRTRDKAAKKRPLYYRHRQRKKLLCVWRIWAHSPILQKQEARNQRGKW